MSFCHACFVVFLFAVLWMIPAVGAADEANGVVPAPQEEDLEKAIQNAHQRLGLIDSQMAALEKEEADLMAQARETQRGQFELHRQIMTSDQEIKALVERIEVAQKELHALQEDLARRMAENPDYAASHDRQAAVSLRTSAIRKETMDLANERVRIQLELESLKKQRAERSGGVAPEDGNSAPAPAEAGADPSAEEPE